MGEDWRDGEGRVYSIALSSGGKKVVSGSEDCTARLWDNDTCKIIARWMEHTQPVLSLYVCWSRDGQSVERISSRRDCKAMGRQKWRENPGANQDWAHFLVRSDLFTRQVNDCDWWT